MGNVRPPKILLVDPDTRVTEMLVDCLSRRFGAQLTCTARAEDALDIEIIEPHDIVLAEVDLPGIDGIALTQHLKELSDRPVILTSARPTLSQAIEALRLGAADFLPKPFPMPYVIELINRTLLAYRRARTHEQRYRRLRRTVRRVLRDRRELNDRIDLICRDLVGAHRRLVHRVLENEQAANH